MIRARPSDWDDSLTTPLEGAAEASAAEGPTSPAVGRDEWVARHGEHRVRRAGVLGTLEQRLAVVPWWAWLTLFAGIVCLLPVGFDSGYVRRVAFDTVVFMLLALGLNVVVGWGGLLDLGYVAFFGIGAYAYALLSSDQYDIHLPTLVAIPLVAIVGGIVGWLVGLPSRRLTGDYLAIVTLFFFQVFLTFTNNGDNVFGESITGRPERDPERRPVQDLRLGHLPLDLGGPVQRRVPLRRARALRRRLRRPPLRQRLAHGPRLAVAARGPARRRGDGHAGQLAEADGVRLRRRRRRAHRDVRRPR